MSKILLITIDFRDYIRRIESAIREVSCADVDILTVGSNTKGISYVLNKLSSGKRDKAIDSSNQSFFFDTKKDIGYKYIIVIVGRGLNVDLFVRFLKCQPSAKKILYLWDDVERIEESNRMFPLFDKIYSFDPVDCKKYGFINLPLFYCNEYRYQGEKKIYDFSCIGGLHSDRVSVINSIMKDYPEKYFRWELLLSSTPMHIVSKYYLHLQKKERYISSKSLSMDVNAALLKQSKSTIDIRYISQNGLTIRTMESLAAKTKIITASQNIVDYDFYNEHNILIIDRNNPKVPKRFIESPYVEIDKSIVEKYSIESWAKQLLEI